MKYLLIIFGISLSCTIVDKSQQNSTLVNPDHKHLSYTGRIKKDHDRATIYWSGSEIEIRFSGTSLTAELKDEKGDNYFNIVLDHDSIRYIKVDTTKRSYVLAQGLPPGEHTVELVKRTEWDKGHTEFFGFSVKGKILQPARNTRIIEYFGDSITAGYAIDDTSGKDSPDSTNTNNYFTYAALTARHFNADAYYTVKSGIGITISWFPLIMPELYNRLDPDDSTSRWDFKQLQPDIVVVNLFQNDSWLVKKPEHPSFKERFGTTPPTSDKIIDAYESFLKQIRQVYPEANIICALGSMDAVKEDALWRSYITTAVSRMNDRKMFVHFFEFNGSYGHPNRQENLKMSKSLISFIEKNNLW